VLKEQHRFFRSVLMATDVAFIVVASVTAYWLRFDWLAPVIPPKDTPTFSTHAIPVFVVAPLMLLSLIGFGLYVPRRDQRFHREAWAILKAVLVGTAVTIVVLSLFRNVLFNGQHYSGWQFAIFGACCAGILMGWRLTFRVVLRSMRRRGWNLRHVAIIGTGRIGQVVYHTLNRNTWTGIKPAFFISHHDEPVQDQVLGLPVRGGLNDLETILDSYDISGVMIAVPGRMTAQLPDLLVRLEKYPVEVRVVPDVNPKFMPLNMSANELDGMPVLSLRQSPLASGWGKLGKRAVDLAGGLAALMIFAIPMLVIAILVRRSGPGPVIFRQQRMSLYGEPFRIFKFRTMHDWDAEQQALRDAGRGTDAWTGKDDPRVTAIGRFLRRTSLDELPQLFNVILGEMSLVGPRPERPELIQKFKEDWRGYMLRQNVKAGMTGWAQVNGLRGDTSLRKRLQYDLFYIRNWSILFDMRILWMTVFKGFVHPNAH